MKKISIRGWLAVIAAGFLQLGTPAFADVTGNDLAARLPGETQRAFFALEPASGQARKIADWIVHTEDAHGLPFAIVDKVNAKVFVFDNQGRIRGAAPALLGLARGDDSVPGIGDREMALIRPEERTTPAGRFVAQIGVNFHGKDVLWVDYDAAISLHRVITTRPQDRRLERLASPTSRDNRISFGCINVPAKFFDQVVSPAFTGTKGIVYVLPEVRSANQLFGSYVVDVPGTMKVHLASGRH
jgi:hypothetical protein